MANTTLTSSGARDLSFITTNPAMDAFERGRQIAQAQLEADQRLEAATRTNVENMASAPSRLRTINANADTAVAGAQVATQTAPYKVQGAYDTMRGGTADANVKVGTQGSRIADAAAGTRLHTTEANVAEQTAPYKVQGAYDASRTGTANADVAVGTVPDRLSQSNSQTRVQAANAETAQMQSFDKTLALLKVGDIAGAEAYAARTGEAIPPEVLQNAEVRDAVIKAWDHAKAAYPNRPQNQAQFMQGFLKDMAERKAQGQPANDPTALYSVPEAPQPQDQSASGTNRFEMLPGSQDGITGVWKHDRVTGNRNFEPNASVSSRAGGAGGNSVYQQKRRDWLAVHPNDEQGALDFAAGRRQLSGAELVRSARAQAIQEINGNALLHYKSENERNAAINRRADENLQRMRQANQPAPAQPPLARPAAPQSALPPPAIDPIARARDAIQRGAPRDAVIQRLRDNGIDPSGL